MIEEIVKCLLYGIGVGIGFIIPVAVVVIVASLCGKKEELG